MACENRYAARRQAAFTLVELLVVVSVIALLVAILLPSLGRARHQARAVVCGSNIRQLHLANSSYAVENNDLYVPAASDMQSGFGGRHRWHGTRASNGVDPDPARNTFDGSKGPLSASLRDGAIKACPQRTDFVTDGAYNAFEAGCGGYGYNLYGIGSRFYQNAWSHGELAEGRQYTLGWWTSRVRRPVETIMFADTAFRQTHSALGNYLTEYSFCEPPWTVSATVRGPRENQGEPATWWLATPTIHFRHSERATVCWTDGHVSAEVLRDGKGDSDRWKLGWFGALGNSFFTPY